MTDPDRIVLRDRSGPVRAAALIGGADDLAARLAAAGVPVGGLVAVVGHRTAELVATLVGLVSRGYGFCIVDAALPGPWRSGCLDAARADAVLVLDTAEDRSQDAPEPGLTTRSGARRDADYVAFTTGTTGRPRVVRCGYRQLAAALAGYQDLAQLTLDDRVPMLAGLSHDPLLREVFGTVLAGAELWVPPPGLLSAPRELATWLVDAQASVANVTPVLLRALAAETPGPLPLRLLVCGGDLLDPRDLTAAEHLAPSATVLNAYGATETPQIAAAGPGPVTGVGPTRVLVRRPDHQPTVVGEVGEIVVESPVLALGYGDATSRGFEAGGCPTCRRFATGDRGRRRADGSVEVLGRTGDEVSIGAERVDLVAVAALLRRELAVLDAAALRLDDGETGRLAAFLVPVGGSVDPVAVRRRLRRVAPPAYVPSAVFELAAIPRDANGKVDRRALAAEAAKALAAPAPVAAPHRRTDAMTEVVAEAYAAVLGLADVPREANFFELGGTSLAMAAVVHLLRRRLDRPLPTLLLFEHPSVATLAAALRSDPAPPTATPPRAARGPSDAHRRTALRRSIRQGGLS